MQIVQALQLDERKGVVRPEGRKPGDKVLVPPTVTTAAERVQDTSVEVTDWCLVTKAVERSSSGRSLRETRRYTA